MEFRKVTVLGASGNMGANVAAIFASFGGAQVYMVCRRKSEKVISRAVQSVRCDSIARNLILADYDELDKCVSDSDLVFESVAEDLDLKKEINDRVAGALPENALYVTGTSGLSITEMAEAMPAKVRGRYFGMHLFNPPYSMTLCELIKTPYTDSKQFDLLRAYAENALRRTVIAVKDRPAFLANRIGFHFINKALLSAEQYRERGGIDYIEAILGPFTGRVMSPCMTADFVGLDVHKAIMDNLYAHTNDSAHEQFRLPAYVSKLITEGKLGRKTGCGLFKTVSYDDGTRHRLVYDIQSGTYRENRHYYFGFAREMSRYLRDGDYDAAFRVLREDQTEEGHICREFLKSYVDYSLYVAEEVCGSAACADDAMATGFNWCPPLAMANIMFNGQYRTQYDYRSFFKIQKE